MKKSLWLLALGSLAAGCAMVSGPPPKDGELAMPSDYKSWPVYLSEVQRPDAKQIRDIYVNKTGVTPEGRKFANGTQFVMELYAAKVAADGTLEKGADGKLVKGNLLKVFVMGKDKGWGEQIPEAQRNGDWIYSAYLPDGKPSSDNPAACRACHMPKGGDDFVFRLDEYLQKKAALSDSATQMAAKHMQMAQAHGVSAGEVRYVAGWAR